MKRKNKTIYLKKSDEKLMDVWIADNFFSRLIGLMFKKSAKHPLLLEIPQNINNRHRSSIHSCFMRFELKLFFIDESNIVFEIADLKPWKYYTPKKIAKYIIEFEKNNIHEFNLKIGDEIEIK